MKNVLLIFTVLLFIIKANAQTPVSGGIYTSTTWTKAASPYIVTGNVVVFPGATLTIEPGVTVKFDSSMYLEIRDAKLIADGSATDHIVFSSNSVGLKAGNRKGIVINNSAKDTSKFTFCDFKYFYEALKINTPSLIVRTLIINNCNFSDNTNGIDAGGYHYIDSSTFRNIGDMGIERGGDCYSYISSCSFIKCKKGLFNNAIGHIINSTFDSNKTAMERYKGIIESCIVTNNEKGIFNEYGTVKIKNCTIKNNSVYGIYSVYGDSILNNEVSNNNVGISVSMSYVSKNRITNNKIGISILGSNFFETKMFVVCNKICSNTDYDLTAQSTIKTNLNFPNNYWCTVDSVSTRPRILDGYIDVKLPLVNFMPLDTSSCYSPTGMSIKEFNGSNANIKLYPNPFFQTATLEFDNPQAKPHELSVFNALGQLVLRIENIKSNKLLIERKELQSGLYFYQLRNDEAVVGAGKMMIE